MIVMIMMIMMIMMMVMVVTMIMIVIVIMLVVVMVPSLAGLPEGHRFGGLSTTAGVTHVALRYYSIHVDGTDF